jgi:hypothetical protein
MASADMSQTLRAALDQLREEKARIDNAIIELENLVNSLAGVRRRGRPPGSGKRGPGRPAASGMPKRKGWNAAARAAAATRMKRYWAERRREKEGK